MKVLNIFSKKTALTSNFNILGIYVSYMSISYVSDLTWRQCQQLDRDLGYEQPNKKAYHMGLPQTVRVQT